MTEMIQINFNGLFPVFPLAGVCLLPHASLPLHIFEPRYVQMVADALDGSGQIAMATFQGDAWLQQYHDSPPVRPVVCIGQIEQHERRPDGRYNILLLGICRARIVDEIPPDDEIRYRRARLEPLETNPDRHEPDLADWRDRVRRLLDRDALARLNYRQKVVDWFDSEDIPSHVLVEIVGHFLITTADDAERRYRLLAEPSVLDRARTTERELRRLDRLIDQADEQSDDWPKGLSWN